MAVLTQHGQTLDGTEIHFLSRDEKDYPQLTRLCIDFDFRVLSIQSNTQPKTTQYLISDKNYREQDQPAITPLFNSLTELESYTDAHIIDILKDRLVEEAED